MRLSYSQVNTYLICPQRYKLQFVDRIQVAPPSSFAFGSCVHGALRFMHDPSHLSPPSQSQVINHFCEAWRAREGEAPEAEWSEYFAEGVKMLTAYCEKHRSAPRLTAQTERNFTIPFIADHHLAGRIDRIDLHPDGSVEVVDYKTTRRVPDQPRIDTDLQLAIYHLAAQHLYPGRPARATFYYVAPGLPISARMGEEQLQACASQIVDVIHGIESEAFGPKTGACDWCGWRPFCMLYRTPELDPDSQADLEQILAEFALLRRELKEKEERLGKLTAMVHERFDASGIEQAEIPGYRVVRTSQKRASYEAGPLRELLEPLGLWQEVVRPDTTAVRRLLDENRLPPEARAHLNNLRQEKTSRALYLRPLAADEE